MNKTIFSIITVALLMGISSCTKEEEKPQLQKWEYKTLTVPGNAYSPFLPKRISVPMNELTTLGIQGWELVDVYTHIETVHPNFGNDKYVTGLQPNIRTDSIVYVFKRPLYF